MSECKESMDLLNCWVVCFVGLLVCWSVRFVELYIEVVETLGRGAAVQRSVKQKQKQEE